MLRNPMCSRHKMLNAAFHQSTFSLKFHKKGGQHAPEFASCLLKSFQGGQLMPEWQNAERL